MPVVSASRAAAWTRSSCKPFRAAIAAGAAAVMSAHVALPAVVARLHARDARRRRCSPDLLRDTLGISAA
jgi:beta-glucosidase-like glycosyl hydrolase